MTRRKGPVRVRAGVILAVLTLAAACGDDDLFDIDPDLREGSGRIWEIPAPGLPEAYDFFASRRLFLGSGEIGPGLGDVFLDGVTGSTDVRLRSISSFLRAEPSHAVEIRDLGPVDFAGLGEVPLDGYVSSEDSIGVQIVEGHVYALRIVRSALDPNFGKLLARAVGTTDGGPDAQYLDFDFVVQVQPGNPRFEED
ncbi:MAG TPA: hypothetical protein VIC56_00365 [Gemmatimonadota bacterium]|jgi:hypothetical protein